MQFGISIPQAFADRIFDPAAQRRYLTRAEELGFESAWTQEQFLGAYPQLSPLEVLTYAAACTERIRLGCAVFVSALHHPIQLAKSIASLDQLSRGRVEVGLGVGARREVFTTFGIPPETRAARFEEGLAAMRALWTGSPVELDGRFWQLHDVGMAPPPYQKPNPPVWIGASHPNALRRAVRLADGFFGAGSTTTAQFVAQMQTVREELDAQGRDPGGFPTAKRVYVAIDDDAGRAHDRLAVELQRLYGFPVGTDFTEVAVYGSPDACIRGLQDVAVAGAGMLMLTPMFDHLEQMERLAADVVPQLR